MTKGPEESQKHQQLNNKNYGNSSQRRLRYLDLSFTSLGEQPRDLQKIKYNGLRPHGGYRGVHNHHPPSIISFDKSMEFRDSVKSEAAVLLEEEKSTSELSPQWVAIANSAVNHSGEHPLFTQQYLSPIKDEQVDGFVLPKPRRCKSAGTRTDRDYFRMASSLHNYLVATPVPPEASNDALLGRPTRTSVLRAKYRSNSAPTYNAGQDTREQLHVQASIIDEQRPIPKVTITALNKEVFPQMDGESLHQWITGAKYNRSHWLEKQNVSSHPFGFSEEATGELGDETNEALKTENENKNYASNNSGIHFLNYSGPQFSMAGNKTTAAKQQQNSKLSSKIAKRNLINNKSRFPANVAAIRQQQNSREHAVIKLPRSKVEFPARGFLPSRHRSKLSSIKDEFIMAGKRYAIDPLSITSLARNDGMLLQGTSFGSPSSKLRPHAMKSRVSENQEMSELHNPLYMIDVPETDDVAKPEVKETADPIKTLENADGTKNLVDKESSIPEPVRKVKIIKSASSRATENNTEEVKAEESGDEDSKRAEHAIANPVVETPGEHVNEIPNAVNAPPKTSEATEIVKEHPETDTVQNLVKRDITEDQKKEEKPEVGMDINVTVEDTENNNTPDAPIDEDKAKISDNIDTEKMGENPENIKLEEEPKNLENEGETKSEGLVEPKELNEEGVSHVSEPNNNIEDNIGLDIESSAGKLDGERDPVVSGSDNTMFITEIKENAEANQTPVEV